MAKRTKNLSLDAVAVGRGERYSALHHTTLSRLVSDFLGHLPLTEMPQQLSPIVSRLLGIAAPRRTNRRNDAEDRTEYRAHLWEKYGRG